MCGVFLGRVLLHSIRVEKELPKSFRLQYSSPFLLLPRTQYFLFNPVSLNCHSNYKPQFEPCDAGSLAQSRDSAYVSGKSPSFLSPWHIFHVATWSSELRWLPVRGKCILYQCQLHKMDITNYNESSDVWLRMQLTENMDSRVGYFKLLPFIHSFI